MPEAAAIGMINLATNDYEYWLDTVAGQSLVAHGRGQNHDIYVRPAGELTHVILTIEDPGSPVPIMRWGRAWEACPETRRDVESAVVAAYRDYWDDTKRGRR